MKQSEKKNPNQTKIKQNPQRNKTEPKQSQSNKTHQPNKTKQKQKTNQPKNTCYWCNFSSKHKHENISSRWVSRVEFHCSLQPGEVGFLHLLCHPRVKAFLWRSKLLLIPAPRTMIIIQHWHQMTFSIPKKYSIISPSTLSSWRRQINSSKWQEKTVYLPLPHSFFGSRGLWKKACWNFHNGDDSLQKFGELHWLQETDVLFVASPLWAPHSSSCCAAFCMLPAGTSSEMWKSLKGDISGNVKGVRPSSVYHLLRKQKRCFLL